MTIYLDNNSTTPTLKEVIKAMQEELDGIPRNPSATNKYGKEGRARLTKSRRTIAHYFDLPPSQICFTSGGTESNNLIVNGFYKKYGGHVISTKLEHLSLLKPLSKISNVTYVDVGKYGALKATDIEKHLRKDSTMLVLSAVNGETGTMTDLEEIGDFASTYNLKLLVDCSAILGKEKLSLNKIDAASFSAHKCHGPKGIGMVISKEEIPGIILGGPQEGGIRAGTENLPAIVGFAKAIELIDYSTILEVRKEFDQHVPGEINGLGKRVSNTSNIYFDGIDGTDLLVYLDQNNIIASAGSACTSNSVEPSHVLINMGYSQKRAFSSLRFSFNRFHNLNDVKRVITALKKYIDNPSCSIFS